MKQILTVLALIGVSVALLFGIVVPTATSTKTFGKNQVKTPIDTNIPTQITTLQTP